MEMGKSKEEVAEEKHGPCPDSYVVPQRTAEKLNDHRLRSVYLRANVLE